MCVRVCVSVKKCPAPGVLDVDCNQDHMTLPQEVLQRRTGSRNTRTTSLVSLVSNPTANRSLGQGGNGRSWWCVHSYVHAPYICICVRGACRLVLMTYLFTESNESRLCMFSRVRAELWRRDGPAARTQELTHTDPQTVQTNEKQMVPLYGPYLVSPSYDGTVRVQFWKRSVQIIATRHTHTHTPSQTPASSPPTAFSPPLPSLFCIPSGLKRLISVDGLQVAGARWTTSTPLADTQTHTGRHKIHASKTGPLINPVPNIKASSTP